MLKFVMVVGTSMEPTLHNGETYYVRACRKRSLKVGDIVVAQIDGDFVIKRITKLNPFLHTCDISGDNTKHSRNFKSVPIDSIKYKMFVPGIATLLTRWWLKLNE